MAKRMRASREVEQADAGGRLVELLSFDRILGQQRAISALEASLVSGRLHHAWIFHGPKGVGKFTTAVAFAALLLDPDAGPDLSGRIGVEDDTPTRRLIRAGGHPDLHVVTKELAAVSRKDTVRSSKQTVVPKEVVDEFLVEPAQRMRSVKANSAACKVFIVDEAELIEPRTQNSLLKVMEEPAPGSIIILVTSHEERLLPTIRSRSQRVAFSPLDEPDLGVWLDRQDTSLSGDQQRWLIRFAGGSPGLARIALDHDLFEWHARLQGMLDAAAAGEFSIDLGPTMADLVDDRAAAAVAKNRDASKDAANKEWARRMLAFIAEDARLRLREAATVDSTERALRAIGATAEADAALRSNVNLRLVMENLAAQLAGAGSTAAV